MKRMERGRFVLYGSDESIDKVLEEERENIDSTLNGVFNREESFIEFYHKLRKEDVEDLARKILAQMSEHKKD